MDTYHCAATGHSFLGESIFFNGLMWQLTGMLLV